MSQDGDGDDGYEFYDRGSTEKRANGSQNKTGEGCARYKTGDIYDGSFVEGKRRGKGIYWHSANGDQYEGYYEENKKHGFGKMTYTNKTGREEEGDEPDPKLKRNGAYLGYFANGQRGCQAGKADPDSDGEEPDSEGTFTYGTGDVYVGQWQGGKKHGRGTYTYKADQTKLEGAWENGQIVNGQWIFPNGTFFCGKFRYNKPFGKGVFVFKDGTQLAGEYIQKPLEEEEEGGGGGGDDEEGEGEKKMPKVMCHFRPGGTGSVRGGFKQAR